MTLVNEVEVSRFPMIPGMSVPTAKLVDALKSGKSGDVLTDAALQGICGRDVSPGGPGYTNLTTAIRHCVREHNVCWQRVHKGECIKCLDGPETVESTARGIRRIGKAARREVTKLKTVDVGKLESGQRTAYLTNRAQLGIVATASSRSTAKKLNDRGEDAIERLRKTQLASLRKLT